MHDLLQTVGWWCCIFYASIPPFWLLIHPYAGYWRLRKRSPYLVLVPLWIAVWVILALLTARWRQLAFYSTGWAWIPAVLLLASGFCLYLGAARNFSGSQAAGVPELQPNPERQLVTSGIHSRIRHPLYFGHLCEMLGWSVGTGLVVCYALTAFAVLTGTVMIRMEDKELGQRFGESFRQYKRAVPAVLPWLR